MWGVAPQSLEAVELALLVHEDVDDDVDEVHQHPIADTAAFDVFRLPVVGLAKALFDRFGDGEHLARIRPVTDDEVVGEIA